MTTVTSCFWCVVCCYADTSYGVSSSVSKLNVQFLFIFFFFYLSVYQCPVFFKSFVVFQKKSFCYISTIKISIKKWDFVLTFESVKIFAIWTPSSNLYLLLSVKTLLESIKMAKSFQFANGKCIFKWICFAN